MTHSRYIKKKFKSGPIVTGGYSSHQKIMTTKMETDLAKHLIKLCDDFYGLTRDKARALLFEFATINSLDIPSSWKTENMA